MQNVIVNPRRLIPPVLCEVLPPRLAAALEGAVPVGLYPEELRLRRGRCASVTVGGADLRLDCVLTGEEMDALLLRFCGGSLYAHGDTLCEGYLTLQGGIRVGVCGRANTVRGRVEGITDVSAFVIRIPHRAPHVGREVCELLRHLSPLRGVLLFAPPAIGKTTLLRAISAQMASGEEAWRVVVVDTRGELSFSLDDKQLLLDVLTGYPRGTGISIAARCMSPSLIVCDEIGDLEEAREIVAAGGCGVPLLASAHASNLADLLSRPAFALLHEAHVFGAYVGISRHEERFDYCYDVITREAADAFC